MGIRQTPIFDGPRLLICVINLQFFVIFLLNHSNYYLSSVPHALVMSSSSGNGKRERGRRRGPSEEKLQLLSMYIQLTCLGLRDAYLVDCGVTDFQAVADICVNTIQSCCVDQSILSDLLVLRVDDDVFVINQTCLDEKLTHLATESAWASLQVVDLNGESLVVPTSSQLKVISDSLLRSWRHIKLMETISVPSKSLGHNLHVVNVAEFVPDELFLSTVGYPFLAGWLLGYSCIYLSCNPTSMLSTLPLKQISLTATSSAIQLVRSIFPPPTGMNSTHTSSTIDLQVYTVPTSLYTSAVLLNVEQRRQVVERICSVLQSGDCKADLSLYISAAILDVCFDSITL